MMKTLKKPGIEEYFFNKIKGFYKKLTANTILTGKRYFPLRSEKRQRCLLLTLLFNSVLEFLVRPIRERKELKAFKR